MPGPSPSVPVSARSWRYYEKIGFCKQSIPSKSLEKFALSLLVSMYRRSVIEQLHRAASNCWSSRNFRLKFAATRGINDWTDDYQYQWFSFRNWRFAYNFSQEIMTDNVIGLSDENGDFIGHIMSFLKSKIIRCSPDYKRDTRVSTLNPTWSVWLKPFCIFWVCHSGRFRSLSKWGSAHPFSKIRGTRRGPSLEIFFFMTLRVVGARLGPGPLDPLLCLHLWETAPLSL